MYLYRMNHGFQNLMFFSIFSFYHPKDEKHKENRYLNIKMLPFFKFSKFRCFHGSRDSHIYTSYDAFWFF